MKPEIVIPTIVLILIVFVFVVISLQASGLPAADVADPTSSDPSSLGAVLSGDDVDLGSFSGDSSQFQVFDNIPQDDPLDLDSSPSPAPSPAPEPTTEPAPVPQQPEPQVYEYDPQATYVVNLNTSKGQISIQMNQGQTPIAVSNFLSLASQGFYNGIIFHRVIEGFMIQGGCPRGDGTGGPGYKFEDEPFDGEYTRGTVAMANSGPDTNGSQFFIMHDDRSLPKDYVIFGRVVSGMEVVDSIAESEVTASRSGETSSPVEPTQILSAEVLVNQ
jgi:cyclophilin family peptidyl-prolyl cis-trans isomerase